MRRALLSIVTGLVVLAPTSAWALDGAPRPGTVEILARDARGDVRVARVALDHALPRWADRRMELGGTWSYLIAEPRGVVVFDVGPRYPLAWSLLPFAPVKRLAERLNGNRHILRAVRRTFPGRPITTIAMSHWHADHTEDAPALQRLAKAAWGVRPDLRIMARDRGFRWRGIVAAGAEAVFQGAGYRPGSWHWGPDLEDGAEVGETGFRVLWLPGHTLGTIALVSDELRMSLGRMPRRELPRYPFWTEDLERYRATLVKFHQATFGYQHYSTHPGKELFEDWPAEPDTAPTKVPAHSR